jgi:uncharacterized protein YjbI with pentapeptide repeats/beta-lactamase regulating signal transducer with metallopeptidase domain
MIAIAATVLNALWQDALLVGAVWLVLHAWPRINAATRYAVWIVTLIAALVVPIGTTLAFFTSSTPPAAATATERISPTSSRTVVMPQRRRHPEIRTIGSPGTMLSLPTRLHVTLPLRVALVVFAAWALLTGYAVIGLLIGLVRLERLKRDALPLPVEYRDSMPQWGAANKGRRPVRLCVSEAIDVPVAVGLFDAMILIPQSLLERLSPGEVEQISLHELAHLRRADDWSNCLQRLIVAALGWNPAAIFIGQQLELEREVACDDWVLASVGAVRPYAMCLTKMAETAAWPHHPMPAPGVFTTRKQISQRIERLLATGRDIATTLTIGPAAAAAAAVAALAIVISFVAPSVAAPAVTVAPAVASAPAVTVAPAVPKKTIATPTPEVKIVRVAVPVAPMVRAAEVHALVRKSIAKELSAAVSQAAIAQSGGKSCAGCDLQGVNWAGRDLRGANYTGVDFSHANLAGVNLSESVLNGADFTKANLSGALFRHAHLTGCDFSQANLEGADFTNAWIAECQFTGARLEGSQLRDILNGCKGCDFSYADLARLNLAGVRIDGDDFTHADLRNVNFAGAELVACDFSDARLDGANFAGATLNGCDVDGVDLRRVDFSKAKIIDMDIPQRNAPP